MIAMSIIYLISYQSKTELFTFKVNLINTSWIITSIGFRQKYATSHALIHLNDTVREQIEKRNFACGKFVDF